MRSYSSPTFEQLGSVRELTMVRDWGHNNSHHHHPSHPFGDLTFSG